MAQTQKKAVNFAALRLAAAEDMATFLQFTKAFNTYEVRSSKGEPGDKSAVKAVDLLHELEKTTGEEIILIAVENIQDKEAVLDSIYEMSIRATRFTK